MAALTFTARANGDNSGSWTFAGGTNGAQADTLANAQLIKGLALTSRLYAFLSATYADKAAVEAAFAVLGGFVSGGMLTPNWVATASTPSLSGYTFSDTGAMRIAISYSASA